MGKLDPGGGLVGRFSTTSSSRRQCWWWGRIWFISLTDSFYKLCQLSALSASILRLPEQTKTGATEALSGLQTARADRNWCHSGERRLAAGLARGGISTLPRELKIVFLQPASKSDPIQEKSLGLASTALVSEVIPSEHVN